MAMIIWMKKILLLRCEILLYTLYLKQNKQLLLFEFADILIPRGLIDYNRDHLTHIDIADRQAGLGIRELRLVATTRQKNLD